MLSLVKSWVKSWQKLDKSRASLGSNIEHILVGFCWFAFVWYRNKKEKLSKVKKKHKTTRALPQSLLDRECKTSDIVQRYHSRPLFSAYWKLIWFQCKHMGHLKLVYAQFRNNLVRLANFSFFFYKKFFSAQNLQMWNFINYK